MKTYFTKKEQIVILIVTIVIVLIFGYKFVSGKLIEKEEDVNGLTVEAGRDENEKLAPNDKKEEDVVEEYKGNIIVHISGQVKEPGIVELEFGKRLIDAVELLGGLTQHADGDKINLAKKLQDEEKIYIPKIGEELEGDLLETVQNFNSTSNNSSIDNSDNKNKIDINLCTKEDLNTLPGIGDVLSGRIIEYRDTNIFKNIEDIKNVSGIGDKKFEGIKDFIIVK